MRAFVFLLLLAAAASAFTIEPEYFDIHDTGSDSLPTVDVGITIDCGTKDLMVDVSSDGSPVEGASTVLFYTDYGYNPLPNPGKTGSDGTVTMTVPGTINFLTGLFILRTDKSGYQSREIEFAYEKCFDEPPPVPEPYNDTNESAVNETPPITPPPPPNVTPPANTTPPVNTSPPANISPPANESPQENGSGPATEEGGSSACPLGIIMLTLLCARVIR
jgi:hypothetical protein